MIREVWLNLSVSISMEKTVVQNNSNISTTFWNTMQHFLQNIHCLTPKGTCDDTFIFQMFMGYLVLPLVVICVLANTCNFAVYTMEYFQKFIAIKMLATKAIMNTLFVLCFLPKALKTIGAWNPVRDKGVELMFWKYWPYILTAMNTFGTCAMWVTVLMTLERYLYIMHPALSPQWVNNRNFCISFVIIFLLSIGLQAVYLISRQVVVTFCSFQGYNKYRYMLRDEDRFLQYEKMFHWFNLFFGIVIPLALLLFMSVVIWYKLVYRQSMSTHYSHEKQTINRITFSTTIIHLLFEIPSMVIFATAAIGGPETIINMPFMCNWHIFASFLTICNSSVMFFIYLIYSPKFRWLFLMRLTCSQHYAVPTFHHEAYSLQVAIPLRSQSLTLSKRNGSIKRNWSPTSHQISPRPRCATWFQYEHVTLLKVEDACVQQVRVETTLNDHSIVPSIVVSSH